MDKRKMNSIAAWVTEYEIYKYYQSIINDIFNNSVLKNRFVNHCIEIGSIDADDIDSIRAFCDDIFKEITDEDIYSALAAAYGYHKQTVKQKIDREYRRADISARVIANDNKPNGLTDEEKELAFQADFVRRVLNSKKRPPILPLNKRSHYITEEDIVAINQIIMNRIRKIYGDKTLSDISPSLKTFYDYIGSDLAPDPEIKVSDHYTEPMCEIKVDEPSDGKTIKRAIERYAEFYDEQDCKQIAFEVTLKNGHVWGLSLNRMPWEERRRENKQE